MDANLYNVGVWINIKNTQLLIYKSHWIVELASVIDGTHILLFEEPYLKSCCIQ